MKEINQVINALFLAKVPIKRIFVQRSFGTAPRKAGAVQSVIRFFGWSMAWSRAKANSLSIAAQRCSLPRNTNNVDEELLEYSNAMT